MSLSRYFGTCLRAALLIGLLASGAFAQPTPPRANAERGARELALGAVVGAPQMHLGASVYGLLDTWGGIGLYVDARFDREDPARSDLFIDHLTARQVEEQGGHDFLHETDAWSSLNLALLRPLGPDLLAYAGAGYATRERFADFFDPSLERGVDGFYRVRDDEESTSLVNFLVGGFFRVGSRLALQLGVESAPRGAMVGVSYRLF